jgi:hypothetical protein
MCNDVKAAHGGSRHVMRRHIVPALEHFALAGKLSCPPLSPRQYRASIK